MAKLFLIEGADSRDIEKAIADVTVREVNLLPYVRDHMNGKITDNQLVAAIYVLLSEE